MLNTACCCNRLTGTRELHLKAFVKSALQQSQAGKYSIDQNLHLLDRAWEAQKLLWQLREAPQVEPWLPIYESGINLPG